MLLLWKLSPPWTYGEGFYSRGWEKKAMGSGGLCSAIHSHLIPGPQTQPLKLPRPSKMSLVSVGSVLSVGVLIPG